MDECQQCVFLQQLSSVGGDVQLNGHYMFMLCPHATESFVWQHAFTQTLVSVSRQLGGTQWERQAQLCTFAKPSALTSLVFKWYWNFKGRESEGGREERSASQICCVCKLKDKFVALSFPPGTNTSNSASMGSVPLGDIPMAQSCRATESVEKQMFLCTVSVYVVLT